MPRVMVIPALVVGVYAALMVAVLMTQPAGAVGGKPALEHGMTFAQTLPSRCRDTAEQYLGAPDHSGSLLQRRTISREKFLTMLSAINECKRKVKATPVPGRG